MDKLEEVRTASEKLLKISNKSLANRNYDKALQCVNAYAAIQYEINQQYASYEAEKILMKISDSMRDSDLDHYVPDEKCVLFYDGFGLDVRGWAVCYVRALSNAGYDLIYVTLDSGKGRIPHIEAELKKENCRTIFIDTHKNYMNWCSDLMKVFIKYRPSSAFFYTTPYDVSATVVFNCFSGKVQRFQIDLTDHAFWLGINAADIFLESRMVGASNAVFERGIKANQIRVLDSCLYINQDEETTPLPFDIKTEKYIFSGGSLYKTLGDEGLQYYRIVRYILQHYPNVKFLYAGSGDATEINKIIMEFPNRAFLIAERKDFFRLFEHCVFFLNTYPMFGGLMMRYAAYANKIPVTLRHNSDHKGILLDQEKRGIEFSTYEEITAEIDRLLSDEDYRKAKEHNMDGAVLTEKQFRDNLVNLIVYGKTEFDLLNIERIDTTEFRAEYISRLDVKETLDRCIIQRLNHNLIWYFPMELIRKILRRVLK